jgi:hypothetical protein
MLEGCAHDDLISLFLVLFLNSCLACLIDRSSSRDASELLVNIAVFTEHSWP